MTEPDLIHSSLSRAIELEGRKFRIEICRIEGLVGWSLEVIDEEGASAVWDDLFQTDHAAFAEVTKAIEEEGLFAFEASENVVRFPKR